MSKGKAPVKNSSKKEHALSLMEKRVAKKVKQNEKEKMSGLM